MNTVPSYKVLLKKYESVTDAQKTFFIHFPDLLMKYPYEVCLAYLFLRTEMAQNRILHCGVVKVHRAHSGLAAKAIETQHLTRQTFLELYKKIFGEDVPQEICTKIKQAESIRDKVVHGKTVAQSEIRVAMYDVLDYADQMNSHLKTKFGFQPFGPLRGFKGRAKPLDQNTTRWLLKGIGFAIS